MQRLQFQQKIRRCCSQMHKNCCLSYEIVSPTMILQCCIQPSVHLLMHCVVMQLNCLKLLLDLHRLDDWQENAISTEVSRLNNVASQLTNSSLYFHSLISLVFVVNEVLSKLLLKIQKKLGKRVLIH